MHEKVIEKIGEYFLELSKGSLLASFAAPTLLGIQQISYFLQLPFLALLFFVFSIKLLSKAFPYEYN